MLTPTGVTSAQYWSAIKAGNPTHVKITFTGQGIVLDDSDISLSSGLVVNEIFNGDIDLIMGKALSKQITVSILNSSKVANLIWTREFKLEMGVEIGNPATTYWVTVGYFTGEQPNGITVSKVIEFTAYDRMRKFDVLADNFIPTIEYPATVQDIYDDLCDYVGLTSDAGNELQNIMSRSYASAPVEFDGYTCRDILAWIAESCGCYARINAAGNVQMVWFTDNTSHEVTGNEEFSLETIDIYEGLIWNNADQLTWNQIDNMTWDMVSGSNENYKIDQIMVKNVSTDIETDYPITSGENVYLIVDNPFLTVGSVQDRNDYIVPIFNRLNAFGGYFPMRIDCIGSWLVEAGDIITVHAYEHILPVPIFVRTLSWNGATNDSYEATGNVIRPVYANEKNREKVINSNEIRLLVSGEYYQKQSGIVINEDGVTITGNKSITMDSDGYVLIHAGHEYDKWTFDAEGLTFEGHAIYSDIPSPGQYITFGISPFTGEFVPNCDSGLFPEFNDDASYVNILLKVYKENYESNPPSAYLHINAIDTYDYTEGYSEEGSQVLLYTDITAQGACTGWLGMRSNMWRRAYIENIYYGWLNELSSRDIKNNIRPLEDFGEAIDKLEPVSFQYKSESRKKSGGRTSYGLIYEDAVKVLPEICTRAEETDDKGINYVRLVPILLKEIQSLRKRVYDLENPKKPEK